MWAKRIFFIIILVFFVGPLLSEQGKENIKITTKLPDVIVYIDGQKIESPTDKDGVTAIESVSFGPHLLKFEKDGYYSKEESIIVNEDNISFPIELKKITILPDDKSIETKSLSRKISIQEPGKGQVVGPNPTTIFAILLFGVLSVVIFVLLWILKSSQTIGLMGKFKLLKIIGTGGIAIIYEAKDLTTKKNVALKVLQSNWIRDTEVVYKFFREGEAISRINETFSDAPVVKVFDYGRNREKSLGIPYISMELLKGKNLLETIKKDKGQTLAIDRKLYIAKEITRGLKAAHQLKIFHGDITPDNIIVDGDKITLIDFGVAVEEHDTFKMMDVSIMGKPVYMSPEQCAGSMIDNKSDVYSLGVIFFLMFYGMPPFISKNPSEIMRMHKECPLPQPSKSIPAEINKLIYLMLEKKPDERPSIDVILETLVRLLV